jgi:transglutaminase-like putative cysteine protease
MPLRRRTFLKSLGLAPIAVSVARSAFADAAPFAPRPGPERTFELITRMELAAPAGETRVWVPVPAGDLGDWFKAGSLSLSGNARDAVVTRDPDSGATMVTASWSAGSSPLLEVTSRFSTRDRAVDPSRPTMVTELSRAERARWLRPTRLAPLDGAVKSASDQACAGAAGELQKVRAIYEWVVDNTYREAATKGCGQGDVVSFLKTRPMGGKCADINRLFVALVRAQGIPAREIYGVRVAPSRFGYQSLGPTTAVVTKAQHCRSEVWLSGVGWMPADPADVRKVALEEPPGHLEMTSEKVAAARKTLFGAWETNWIAYNTVQDVRLPGSAGETLPFLMYPQAEVGGVRMDCYGVAPCYSLAAREV